MDKYRLKLVFIVFASLIIIVSIIIAIPFNSSTLPAKMVVSEIFSGIGGLKKRFILDSNIKNNEILLDKYLKDNYGIALTKTFTIIDATAYNDSNQVYRIDTPFFENGFRIEINNAKHKVVYNNFISKLTKDPKFQHLYSEWVKKQVGIEDEDVELKFAGNFDKPYIEFDKITTLSEDYREVFENTHNLYAWLCEVKNIKDLDKNNVLDYSQKIREDYLLKAISKTGMPSSSKYGGRIYLSKTNNAREKGNSYKIDFDINDKNDIYSELKCKKIE